MKKQLDKDAFVSKPQYPGGKNALIEFINQNLQYPNEALENSISGKVLLSFKVNFDGHVSDIKVIKGIGYGCDEEAVRVVGLLKFTETKNKGSKVSIQRKLAIHFNLPKPDKTEQSPQINYIYTSKNSNEQPKRTYQYTIDLE